MSATNEVLSLAKNGAALSRKYSITLDTGQSKEKEALKVIVLGVIAVVERLPPSLLSKVKTVQLLAVNGSMKVDFVNPRLPKNEKTKVSKAFILAYMAIQQLMVEAVSEKDIPATACKSNTTH